MIVREIRDSDFKQVLGLIHEFQAESIDEYKLFCDDNEALEMMIKLKDNTLVLETEEPVKMVVGVISGIITNYFINKHRIFQEVIWYVTRKYRHWGVKLYKEAERRCRLAGIKQMIMVHMGNSKPEKLERFYGNMGYRMLETQYIKTL